MAVLPYDLCYHMAYIAAWPVLQYSLCYHMAVSPDGLCYRMASTTVWPSQTHLSILHSTFVTLFLTYSICSIWGVDGWPIHHSLLCRLPSLSIHISLKAANISAGRYTYMDNLLKLDECTDDDHHMQWTTCPSPIHISNWVEPLLSHSDHKFAA